MRAETVPPRTRSSSPCTTPPPGWGLFRRSHPRLDAALASKEDGLVEPRASHRVPRRPRPRRRRGRGAYGDVTRAGAVRLFPGGSAANFAGRGGARARPSRSSGAVGDDVAGRLVVAELAREGVIARVQTSPNEATGTILVLVGADGPGSTRMISDPGASSSFAVEDLDAAALAGADLVHVTGYSWLRVGAAAVAAREAVRLARAPATGPPVLCARFDPGPAHLISAYGGPRFMSEIAAAGFDVLFPNLEEGEAMTGEAEPRTILAAAPSAPPRRSSRSRWGREGVSRRLGEAHRARARRARRGRRHDRGGGRARGRICVRVREEPRAARGGELWGEAGGGGCLAARRALTQSQGTRRSTASVDRPSHREPEIDGDARWRAANAPPVSLRARVRRALLVLPRHRRHSEAAPWPVPPGSSRLLPRRLNSPGRLPRSKHTSPPGRARSARSTSAPAHTASIRRNVARISSRRTGLNRSTSSLRRVRREGNRTCPRPSRTRSRSPSRFLHSSWTREKRRLSPHRRRSRSRRSSRFHCFPPQCRPSPTHCSTRHRGSNPRHCRSSTSRWSSPRRSCSRSCFRRHHRRGPRTRPRRRCSSATNVSRRRSRARLRRHPRRRGPESARTRPSRRYPGRARKRRSGTRRACSAKCRSRTAWNRIPGHSKSPRRGEKRGGCERASGAAPCRRESRGLLRGGSCSPRWRWLSWFPEVEDPPPWVRRPEAARERR